jgi:hypothetical protein
LGLKAVIISKSDKSRFLARFEEMEIVFYGSKSDHFYQYIEGPEEEIDIFIIDYDFPDFPEMSSMTKGRVIPFTGDYGKARAQIEPLLQKKEQEQKAEESGIEQPVQPQFITKERRVTESVVMTKEIMKPTTVSVTRKLILIGSCDRGTGCSFLVRNLCEMLGSSGILTALIELPLGQPYHFDRSLLPPGVLKTMTRYEEKAFHNDYVNVPYLISQGKVVSGEPLYRNGVQYFVPHPDLKISGWTSEHSRKLVGIAKNAVISIVDVGMYWRHPAVLELLNDADELLLVQSCEPARLERTLNPKYLPGRIFNFLLNTGKQLQLVFNFFHTVPSRDFLTEHFQFDAVQRLNFLPSIERKIVNESAYEGGAEYLNSNELKEALGMMVSSWVPHMSFHDGSKPTGIKNILGPLISKIRRE